MFEIKKHIVVRTSFEGYHCYPNAGSIDPRIKFLESLHRHMFHVTAKLQVFHGNRELEFFLVKWSLEEFLKTQCMSSKSCELIAEEILYHLQNKYGFDRDIVVSVSEDGESDGVIEYKVIK